MTSASLRKLVPLFCVMWFGCRGNESTPDRYPRVAGDDSSILLAEPFRTTTGTTNKNGTAFDRAEVRLDGAEVIWLPDGADRSEVEVLSESEAGKVVIELEKRWFDYSHTDGTDIRQTRKRVEVRAARTAGAFAVVVSRGWSHRHGGMQVIARVRVPAGVRVERGEPPRAENAEPLAWEVIPQTSVPVPEAKR